MELFEKIYGRYYEIVRTIVIATSIKPRSRQEIEQLARSQGFQESALAIVPKLMDGSWPFLSKQADGRYTCALRYPNALYSLTTLQKSWLSALLLDPRIALFLTEQEQLALALCLEGITPCWKPDDFRYFDRYQDADSFDSPDYQKHFQSILTAMHKKQAMFIVYTGKTGITATYELIPREILYSSRDDKFRIICFPCRSGRRHYSYCFNLERIQACTLSRRDIRELRMEDTATSYMHTPAPAPVVIEISGARNSLERCMLHFAQYKKQTEYDEQKKVYYCSIFYDIEDEPQLLIEILSFGPVIRVLGPESFVQSIRDRVTRQHELFYLPL